MLSFYVLVLERITLNIFLVDPFPEDHRRTFLPLPDMTSSLLALIERKPVGAAVFLASQHEHVHAFVLFLADKILGIVTLSIPRLAPRDSSILKQGLNPAVDDIVDVHSASPLAAYGVPDFCDWSGW